MNFSAALNELKAGKRIARNKWNSQSMYLEIYIPTTETSSFTNPYIVFFTAPKNYVPWCPSQTDLLEEDWEIIDDRTKVYYPYPVDSQGNKIEAPLPQER